MCGNQVERSEHQFWEESNAGGPIAPREETQVKDDRHASLCVCTTTEMATLQGGKMEGMSGQSSIEQGKKDCVRPVWTRGCTNTQITNS